jgi:hypothetical protein
MAIERIISDRTVNSQTSSTEVSTQRSAFDKIMPPSTRGLIKKEVPFTKKLIVRLPGGRLSNLVAPRSQETRLPDANPNAGKAEVYKLPTYRWAAKDIKTLEDRPRIAPGNKKS